MGSIFHLGSMEQGSACVSSLHAYFDFLILYAVRDVCRATLESPIKTQTCVVHDVFVCMTLAARPEVSQVLLPSARFAHVKLDLCCTSTYCE